ELTIISAESRYLRLYIASIGILMLGYLSGAFVASLFMTENYQYVGIITAFVGLTAVPIASFYAGGLNVLHGAFEFQKHKILVRPPKYNRDIELDNLTWTPLFHREPDATFKNLDQKIY